MLSKRKRLTRESFALHFKTGKRHHSPVATLIVSPSESFHGAVVVSKKVHKKAVKRNTFRRRAYAQLYAAMKAADKNVHIIILKPPFAALSRTEQHAQLADLIAQAA